MKKIILYLALILSSGTIYGQGVVNRAGAANTVKDSRFFADKNLGIPTYLDTTDANQAANIGVDSCGTLIMTYNDNKVWKRACNPKRWESLEDAVHPTTITNITVATDSSISFCNAAGACTELVIATDISIASAYMINDSTIVMCDTLEVCDTAIIPAIPLYVAQNGLTYVTPRIVELGGTLLHQTTLHTLYNRMNFKGHPVYNYPYNFSMERAFGTGTGVVSFLHTNNNANSVKLGINYTENDYPDLAQGYMGDKIGYMINVNGTGNGSYGFRLDNSAYKFGGIFLHTKDIANTDAITFFGTRPPGGTVQWNMHPYSMDSTRIMILRNNKDIVLKGYTSSRPDDEITEGQSIVYMNDDGKMELGPPVTATSVSDDPFNAIEMRSDGLYVFNTVQDGVVSGGIVTWVENYSYHISAASYYIGGIHYNSPDTTITLSAPDATYNRIDAFIVTDQSRVEILQGSPSDNPLNPTTDPEEELLLSFALVETGTTAPTTIVQEWIYQEDTEWTTTESTARIESASAEDPYAGSVSIEGTSVENSDNIIFESAVTVETEDYKALTFKLKSKGDWGTAFNRKLGLRFLLDGTVKGSSVLVSDGAFGYDADNTADYQTISIPITAFNIPAGTEVNQFKMTAAIFSGSFGFYIDDIQLQGGLNTPVQPSGGIDSLAAGNIGNEYTTSIANPGGTNPVISFTPVAKAANTVFAGPLSGSAAAPSFRALDTTDIPNLHYYQTMTQLTDTSFTLNRPDGTKDTVAVTLGEDAAIYRFGVSGEDDAAAEDRIFDASGQVVSILGGTSTYFGVDENNYMGVYGSGTEKFAQLLFDGTYAAEQNVGVYDTDTRAVVLTLTSDGAGASSLLSTETSTGDNFIFLKSAASVNNYTQFKLTPDSVIIRGLSQSASASDSVLVRDADGKIKTRAQSDIGGGGATSRFGVSGEDDAAAEDRSFDANGYNVTINDAASISLYTSAAGVIDIKSNSGSEYSNLYVENGTVELSVFDGTSIITGLGAYETGIEMHYGDYSLDISSSGFNISGVTTKTPVSTDSVVIIDNAGKLWVAPYAAGGETDVNIYEDNGTVTANRTIDLNSNGITFQNINWFNIFGSTTGAETVYNNVSFYGNGASFRSSEEITERGGYIYYDEDVAHLVFNAPSSTEASGFIAAEDSTMITLASTNKALTIKNMTLDDHADSLMGFNGDRAVKIPTVKSSVVYTGTVSETLDRTHYLVGVDVNTASGDIYLPAIADCRGAQEYVIFKWDNSANTVTIHADGSETIEGSATKVLSTQYQKIRITADKAGGTKWIITYSN